MGLIDRFLTPVDKMFAEPGRECLPRKKIFQSAGSEWAGSFLPISPATRSDSTAREFTTLELEWALLPSRFFSGSASWSDQKLEQLPICRFGHHCMRS
jgi:hypothetical protein